MDQKPALIECLDKDRRISSKWVAKECGKQHKNVIRDIEVLQNEDGSSESHLTISKDCRGYVKEILMDLPFVIMLLGRYEGPRAIAARRLIRQALDYFINRAPQLEKENRELKEQVGWVQTKYKRDTQKSLPAEPSKVQIRRVKDTLEGFPIQFETVNVTPEQAKLVPHEVELAKLAHLGKTKKGVDQKYFTQLEIVTGVHKQLGV